jgi:hypothetical protein
MSLLSRIKSFYPQAPDMPHVLVSDIETVPDLAGFAAANGHDGKSDDEIRAELGDKFPKHILSLSPFSFVLKGWSALTMAFYLRAYSGTTVPFCP